MIFFNPRKRFDFFHGACGRIINRGMKKKGKGGWKDEKLLLEPNPLIVTRKSCQHTERSQSSFRKSSSSSGRMK